MKAYGRSKTADILFAVEFDRRHGARGIRATAVHPGGIMTELARYRDPAELQRTIDTINTNRPAGAPPFKFKTVPQGAATTVWAGVVARVGEVGAHYCEDCHVAEIAVGETSWGGVQAYVLNSRTRESPVVEERRDGRRVVLRVSAKTLSSTT